MTFKFGADMRSFKTSVCLFVSVLSLSMGAVAVKAQEIGVEGANDGTFFSREENIVIDARKEVLESYSDHVLRPAIPSLLFLPAEHELLLAAKSNFLARLPTEEELEAAGENGDTVQSIRTVSLEGILYTGESDWVIWLNSQRITPDAIPVEIIDLVVSNEYINVKWFDKQTNKIYPIRLRPNQVFNLDARMFLPG